GTLLYRCAVPDGTPDDPIGGRRRRSRAGDLYPRPSLSRAVHARHQPQGLAFPHPDEHHHQRIPKALPAASDRRTGRRRRLLALPADVTGDAWVEFLLSGEGIPRWDRLERGERGARGPSGEVPDHGPPRCGGVLLQGDRRDGGRSDRDGHVAASPRAKVPAAAALRPGPRAWDRRASDQRATAGL